LRDKKNEIREKQGDKQNLASGLGNMAGQQLVIGALSAAERNLRRAIELDKELESEYDEACEKIELGCVLLYRGMWNDSEQELKTAEKLFEKEKNVQSLGVTWSYRALRFLLIARETVSSNQSSIECAKRALELADENARISYPVPRDYVRAYWLLGAAYCANNELTLAEENLSEALNLCRRINMVDYEADILIDLVRLRYAQGDFKDAQEKASEALMITERCGYVLQGADVHLFLAALAEKGYKLEEDKDLSDKDAALLHAREALKLATCDGPPYYYKVAYEEAELLIARLQA
jgi:tetratricopeptide (TPR) repeat protein